MKKNGMQVSREIHALDYAVCAAVSLLDRVFRGHCDGRWNVSRGLNLEIVDRQQDTHRDVLVIVHPAGWKEGERITLRCAHFGGKWEAFEGTIFSECLPEQLERNFSFKINAWYSLYLCIEPRGTLAERFLASIKA